MESVLKHAEITKTKDGKFKLTHSLDDGSNGSEQFDSFQQANDALIKLGEPRMQGETGNHVDVDNLPPPPNAQPMPDVAEPLQAPEQANTAQDHQVTDEEPKDPLA